MDELITITGSIINYIYTSNDSLYKVCKLLTLDEDEIVIVGSFPRLEEGLNYEFRGYMKEHQKYGEQFVVSSYAKSHSFTKEGLISYLSSDKFPGIGPKLASYIVLELGLTCIDLILEDPNCLDNVYGITKKKKELIYESLKANYESEQVFIRLYGFGLSDKMIYRLYEVYGDAAANRVEENPYRLIYDIEGYGFKKADALALSLGFKENDMLRIKSALIYTLTYVCYQQGFTYLTKEQLINSTKNLLGNSSKIEDVEINEALEMLLVNNELIFEDDRIFDSMLYKSEVTLAEKIMKMYETKVDKYDITRLKNQLKNVSRDLNIKYTDLQEEAIINSLNNKLSIITGGPGTGKSTILNAIIRLYAYMNKLTFPCDELSYKVMLVAPTGRAAKRMEETTNMHASTIHKALGYNYEGGFSYNENCLLSPSLLIVDEASMLDVNIASSLFKALPNSCRVILVGDSNQLPSVSPGNVLHDLISSDKFHTTRLREVLRQDDGSNIVKLSNMVLNEKIDYTIFSKKKDVFLYDCDSQSLKPTMYKLLDNFIKSGGDLHNDIQILIPMYAGVAGIDEMNKAITEKYNLETLMLIRDNQIFKVNDKVLQLKNDPELGIMNGDIGKVLSVTKVDNKDALLIDFDGKVVTYFASQFDNLKLAYAISIHKSQGSEYSNVILPILPSYNIMLKKKLIYTAITRAKKKLIIVGKIDSLNQALHNVEYQRQTSLYQRLENMIVNDNKIYDKDIPFDTLGEYDMDGITPYSFM
jgi:exodeoxyribonuclease V alpha subunit